MVFCKWCACLSVMCVMLCVVCVYILHCGLPSILTYAQIHNIPLQSGATASLEWCLRQYTASEVDSRRCPCCNTASLRKAIALWRLPKVLIIQLVRFKHSPNTGAVKLNNHVGFPVTNLNMLQFVAPERQEDLTAE